MIDVYIYIFSFQKPQLMVITEKGMGDAVKEFVDKESDIIDLHIYIVFFQKLQLM